MERQCLEQALAFGIIWIAVCASVLSCWHTWPRVRKQRLIRAYLNTELTKKRGVKTKVIFVRATNLRHLKIYAAQVIWPGKHTLYATWTSVKYLVRLQGDVQKNASRYRIRSFSPCSKKGWSETTPLLVMYHPKKRSWSCALFGNAKVISLEGTRVPGEEDVLFLGRLLVGPLSD